MTDESAEDDLPPTLTIELDPPVGAGNVKLSALILHEPTLGQVRDAQLKLDDMVMPSSGAQREYELTFVALNAGKGRGLIDELPVRALTRAVAYLERFVAEPLPDPPGEGDNELSIQLDAPLKAPNGGEVHTLDLREPRGGEMRAAEELVGRNPLPGTVRRYQARLIEKVTGLPALVVAQIPIRRAKEAIRFLEGFERSARPTPNR